MKNFLSLSNLVLVILIIYSISFTSALTTFGKTNTQNQNPPSPSTPVMVEVVTAISRPSVTFEIARLTSMGRASGGRPGMKTSHSGHGSLGKGRDCKVNEDCVVIQNATCLSDPHDGKKRCLCGDYSTPINGHCNNKYKAVGAPCDNHEECDEGAECIFGNNTSHGKKCQCMEGYYEENNRCNGSQSIFNSSSIILIIFTMLLATSMN
ncbi:uncharacterized protein sosie [Chelonus insularis]|uniref:uncharacterized protein sosie n=1 Tax=Chelonus insularis TaxID=460826 RepID=UPI001589B9F5|nr:uncharacterized protein LOC118070092 [Chelonus insularis]